MRAEAARRVLDTLLDGVDDLHSGLDGRYPLFRRPGEAWVTSRRGSWTGGLWSGLLWLRALERPGSAHAAAARRASGGLAVWAEADTATRGLVFWYPLALARFAVPGGVAPLEEAAGRAARSLGGRFDPGTGVVPWGGAFEGAGDLVRVDGAPGVAPLMREAPGVSEAVTAAGAAHLVRHLRLCWDGSSVAPVWRLDGDAAVRDGAPTRYWSRGRAWLLTAFADAVRLGLVASDDPELGSALDADAPLVPPADAEEPKGPVDTGAAAIEAAALLRLARAVESSRTNSFAAAQPRSSASPRPLLGATGQTAQDRPGAARTGRTSARGTDAAASAQVPDSARHGGTVQTRGEGAPAARAVAARARAHAIVRTLQRDHLGTHGLEQGSYETADGLVTGIESVWGNFFLALAAAMALGTVPADLV
ncbi:hypothetical protein [Nocardiopsis sp. FIRDI 009]|uniref:hypothetical protein n=1 Tax=Nocardiopsis sp. FIRDI 009 TaxID=714197 RepID=UPI000E26D45D|nr:hypothetical protein [Nocardiopsis sp. FIRDI 009]